MRPLASAYKAWLFVKRGMLSMLSYRTALVLAIFSGFLSVIQFGLLARFVSQGNSFPLIEQYGGNLLAYLVIGSTFTSFVSVALNSYQGAIRSEQQMGTLEHLLMADLSLSSIMLYSALWNFVNALLNTALLFLIAVILFDIHLSINLVPTLFTLLLTVLSLSGIGMISAGIIMVTKQGDPVGWIFTTLTGLLSGVLFPVEMLPAWLQTASAVLPTTHALRALRLTLTRHAEWADIQKELLFLVATLILTLPCGLLSFKLGLNRARRSGSLAEY